MNENEKEKKKTSKTEKISYVLSAITVLAAIIAAAFARVNITEKAEAIYAIAFLVSLALLLLIPLANKLLLKKAQNGKINVKNQRQDLMRRRGEAEKSLAEAAKRTVFLRRAFNAYTAFLIALTAFALFACIVATIKGYTYIPVGLFALQVLLTPLYQTCLRINESCDFSEHCSPDDYKKLHSLAHKAARTVGIDGEIRIILLLDCNMGIAQIGKTYSLQAGHRQRKAHPRYEQDIQPPRPSPVAMAVLALPLQPTNRKSSRQGKELLRVFRRITNKKDA